jgi:Polyketide cyclase / dehydrase and lipid transport
MATEPSNSTTTQPPGLKERERATGLSINESAPAIARATARIEAAPEIVFRILSDVANWPSWQHSVSSVEIEGPVSSGATFRWKTGCSRIVSTVELFDPPHAIGWRGRTSGHARSTYGGSRRRDQERRWKPRSLSKAGSSLS